MTWTKAMWWSDDQHLKQDLRSIRKYSRYRAKSKHEDRNQAGRKITKKRAHWSDRTLDRTLVAQWPDAPIKRLGRSSDQTLNNKIDQTQDSSVRSSTERFQSGEIATERWQRPITILPASGHLCELVSLWSCVWLGSYLRAWTLLDILDLLLYF